MSFQALAWAIKQTTGSSTAKAVLCALADFANDVGECWPHQDTIASRSEQTTRSVRTQIQALIDKGLLERALINGRQGYRLLISDRNNIPVEGKDVPEDGKDVPPTTDEKAERGSGGAEYYSSEAEGRSAASEPLNEPINEVVEKRQQQRKFEIGKTALPPSIPPADPQELYFRGHKFSLTKPQFDQLFERFSLDGNKKRFVELLDRWDNESQLPLTYSMLEARLASAWRSKHQQGQAMRPASTLAM